MTVRVSKKKPSLAELVQLENELFGSSLPGRASLAFDSDALLDLLIKPDVIFVSAIENVSRRFVGYAAGQSVAAIPFDIGEKEQLITPSDAFYFLSNGVSYEFRNRGIGARLLLRTAELAKAQGYTIGAGHFREGASASIARKNLSVTSEFPIPDHCGTGETYHYIIGRL